MFIKQQECVFVPEPLCTAIADGKTLYFWAISGQTYICFCQERLLGLQCWPVDAGIHGGPCESHCGACL